MAYTLIWVHDGVTVRYTEVLTSEDLVNSTLDIHRSADFDSLHWVINDMRDCTKVIADQSALEEVVIADIGASHSNARIKVAIVTTSLEALKLAEQYRNAMREVLPTEIFPSMEEARGWFKLMDDHLNLPRSFSISKFW